MTKLDRRLNAYRADLAEEALRGTVEAAAYVPGEAATVAVPVLDMAGAPRPDAGLDTQLILGDRVTVFDEAEGFAWVKAGRDGYVGYVPAAGLSRQVLKPSHIVSVPRTFIYREPDMKKRVTGALSLGSLLTITGETETRGTRYALLDTGEALIAGHLRPVDHREADFVAVAETLERTPYLWGGTSAFGIDCSGLVQLSMRMAGRQVLRDTDMQAESIGEPLEIGEDLSGLRRGDLVFWNGHVAIMADAGTIIHANGHTMMVSREPLAQAVERIAWLYGRPTGYRRP